jgi:hypothetical protein
VVNLVSKTKVSAPFNVPLNSGFSYTLIVYNHNLGALPSNVNLRLDYFYDSPGTNDNAMLYDFGSNLSAGGTGFGWWARSCTSADVEIEYYRFGNADVRVVVTG